MQKITHQQLLDWLKKEVKLSLGCTEPIAIVARSGGQRGRAIHPADQQRAGGGIADRWSDRHWR